MFPHFVSIITIFGTSLFCSYILTIILILVVSIRFWLIIWWPSGRLWLIIRLVMFSTILPIVILFSFTNLFSELIYLCQLVKSSNNCWCSTNNYNIFIFNGWFFFMLVNIFGGLWCTVKWRFGCCCSCTSLNVVVLLIENEWKTELGHNHKEWTC